MTPLFALLLLLFSSLVAPALAATPAARHDVAPHEVRAAPRPAADTHAPRLVLRRGDTVLPTTDTVRIAASVRRQIFPSDDPAHPDPLVILELTYPDLDSYTVGTAADRTLPAFTAAVTNLTAAPLRWCGITSECTDLPSAGDREARTVALPGAARLPLRLEAPFDPSAAGTAVARLTLTPSDALAADASAGTVAYVIKFTYTPVPAAVTSARRAPAVAAPRFDLLGRPVRTPQPGRIYIVGGRKVVAAR